MQNNKLPIGYYLKKIDNLLTKGINRIHGEFAINRTQWQIIHSIYENDGISREQIAATLKEFADSETLANATSDLINRGLVRESTTFTLTEKGKELHKQCFEKQKEFRQKAMRNISEEEYLTTISTLEKMIDNLK